MKRLFFSLFLIPVLLPISAEEVGRYTNSFFDDTFSVTTVLKKDGSLSSARIAVLTHYHYSIDELAIAWKTSKQGKLNEEVILQGSIGIVQKNIERFKAALASARDEYMQIRRSAQDAGLSQLKQKMQTKFPKVFASTSPFGYSEWFKFGVNIKLKCIMTTDGRIVAVWRPTVTLTNPSNRQQSNTRYMYLVFACEEDFNSLISQLDKVKI